MIQPQELEVWYVLPALRRELAKSMVAQGLSQKSAAGILGVTESAVSQYIRQKRAKRVRFDKDLKEQILRSAKKLSKRKSCVTREIQKLLRLARKKHLVCRLHREHGALKECGGCLK